MPVKTLQELGFDPNSGVMLGDIGTGAGAFPQPPVMSYIGQQIAAGRQNLTGDPQAEAEYKRNMAGIQRSPGTAGTPFQSRVTYYAPGVGGRMEGPWATSKTNPLTGQRIPATLDDVRLGRSPFVTVASDPSRYGQKVQLGDLTYRSPIDGKTYTLPSVQGLVHDTGSAFRGRPDKLDVATGDFRGFSPSAASSYVNLSDGGRRMVTTDGSMGGWNTTVGADPSGVGYAAPDRVAQGATTNPAELVKKDQGNFLGRFLANFDFTPVKAKAAAAPPLGFAEGKPFQFTPVGKRR